jgi:hydroxylamine reductase
MSMFCYQCEQTARGTGCDAFGVCGKDPDTAVLQDLLVHATQGIAQYAHRARALGARHREIDVFVIEALFTTVTNVNFDPARLEAMLRRAGAVRDQARALYRRACEAAGRTPEEPRGPAEWSPAPDRDGLVRQGEAVGVESRIQQRGPDLAGLEQLVLYGLKGMAAYADHACILGREDAAVYAFFHEALDVLARGDATADDVLALALRCGEANLKVMELLDAANTGAYGTPVPTPVRMTPVQGPAILVSGHDLKDLAALLEQTAGTGIHVYTHGEMLPAHGYPKLKKYPHLVGHYGGAWQDQRTEFDAFPGAILMTTNCLQKPKDSYRDRLFTCGLVAWPGVTHIAHRDFAPLIAAARAAGGFARSEPEKTILVGFGHGAILAAADQVVAAVKNGSLRRIFLIGGCDGAKSGRNYYTEFAKAVPPDCLILTLACGKFRFNRLEFGTLGGLPRLLDCGQCNDAYSAIRVAGALAEAFGGGLNDLPLSLVLSWYEQKAVCILLTLLHLGVKNIRLGPTLPAFLTPPVRKVLAEKFALKPTAAVAADLEAALAGN